MFSGIVERTAEVVAIRTDRQNRDFTLRADFCGELKIDQSIAHNGVCLTVVGIEGDTYTVTAMKETLDRSNLGLLRTGDLVNLERSMKPDALLDGHIVQGHVDQTAVCTAKEDADGSWYFTFEYEPQGGGLCTVEKAFMGTAEKSYPLRPQLAPEKWDKTMEKEKAGRENQNPYAI